VQDAGHLTGRVVLGSCKLCCAVFVLTVRSIVAASVKSLMIMTGRQRRARASTKAGLAPPRFVNLDATFARNDAGGSGSLAASQGAGSRRGQPPQFVLWKSFDHQVTELRPRQEVMSL
jgi:hypothetical protein